MAKLAFLIVLTAFLACQISQSNAGISSDSWPYPPKQWKLLNAGHNQENRAYLACKGRKGPSPQTQLCIVGYHKLTHSTEDRICDVNIRVRQKDAYIGEDPKMFLFGKDKAIVVWREFGPRTYLRMAIIPPTGCNMTTAKIPAAVSEDFRDDFRFTSGNKSFDVFFNNATCGNKICWLTYNDLGKRINGPAGYIEIKDHLLPNLVKRIEEDAPEKGHFLSVPTKDGGTGYFLAKPDGTSKLLAESPGNNWSGVSLANNLVGMCFQSATGRKCAQYDFDGKMKLEVNMDMDLPEFVYNLANGGFLFTSRHKDDFFLVTKTDSNGANIGNLKCFGDLYFRILYENEEGKYCLSEPCERKTPAGSSTIECFDDTVFSK